MKLYVWDCVGGASGNYHDQGGIVVIAETLERARELVTVATKDKYSENRDACEALTKEPDLVRECEGPEHIAVHPDAGCC